MVISMDFIIHLLRKSKQNDSIVVVVDRLKKVAHFLLVKSTYSARDVTHVFIRDVVRLHNVLKKIVLDRDAKFTSKFWMELFTSLGTELAFSIAYHLQTD